MSVLVETSVGNLVIDLYTEECPRTSLNFIKLCKVQYYNGVLFFSVIPDFAAQTGDPTGTGEGGSAIHGLIDGPERRFVPDELRQDLQHTGAGLVSMANAGPDTNASQSFEFHFFSNQFIITLGDNISSIDGKNTVFGEVAEGWDVLDKLNTCFLDEKNRPLVDIRIRHTYILDDPFDDPPGLASLLASTRSRGSPEVTRPREETVRPRLNPEEAAGVEDEDPEETEERVAAEQDRARAVMLELTGDLPDAEIRPPENVLFVCKLNPVTTSEGLRTLFSRFGDVVSCEVIRDKGTGRSLNYAFVEFESRDICELAYFKADNMLVDDRRIRVDFSQSVSKLWRQYRQGRPGQFSPPAGGRGVNSGVASHENVAGNRPFSTSSPVSNEWASVLARAKQAAEQAGLRSNEKGAIKRGGFAAAKVAEFRRSGSSGSESSGSRSRSRSRSRRSSRRRHRSRKTRKETKRKSSRSRRDKRRR